MCFNQLINIIAISFIINTNIIIIIIIIIIIKMIIINSTTKVTTSFMNFNSEIIIAIVIQV